MDGMFCLVVNPAADHGGDSRLLPQALGALADGPTRVRVCESLSLTHAAQLAREAVARGETVIAVGGDGLVGTLAGAVASAGGELGIIPAGRGNDFARMLGIPTRPAAAAAVLAAGHRRLVDLLGVRVAGGPEQVVAGSVYLGVPSEGGELVANGPLLPGPAGYQLAGVRALLKWRQATFSVDTGDGPGPFRGFCVVAANSAYLAAGTMAAPAADVSDGLLDVIMVRDGWKLSFLQVMLLARSGGHVRLGQVSTARAASVTVTTDRAMPVGADGETLPAACPLPPASPLRVRVLPAALRVIAPPADGTGAPLGRAHEDPASTPESLDKHLHRVNVAAVVHPPLQPAVAPLDLHQPATPGIVQPAEYLGHAPASVVERHVYGPVPRWPAPPFRVVHGQQQRRRLLAHNPLLFARPFEIGEMGPPQIRG
jgi:diacylglycerol kinase (ATP)